MKNYIIGLNGIRAIAVFFVIISHRFPENHILHSFPLGKYGVDIFFVLSGFLISRGLFFQINLKKNDLNSKVKILKNFFINRSLRIFPIYYLLLLFLYLTKGIIGNSFKENVSWYLLYGANYLNYLQNKWFGPLSHLWSLSVEEQFYILFPLLLVFVFRKRILLFLILLIIIGTFYPFFIDGIGGVLTLSCVNAFGIGGLFAYIEVYKKTHVFSFYKWTLFLSIPILFLIIVHNLYITIPFFPERLAISVIAIHIIALCYLKPNSFVVNKIFNNKFLNFVGVISYGVYLYHNIVPKYWNFILTKLNICSVNTQFSYIEFLFQTTFIIGLSYLSWIIIEKPILKLKKYN
ncbi:acyltransferase family protein [Flavobacterium urocaniciphilum]|uniref:Peptidoglycan/LPS O-acetylase OafA/YrhL, contains acyltransferase and SGNH-hydrolase domains n=1 Tax=Flavobacterium urocaniciphilum TaxID=1299341 RepID=A0A1H8YS45_9FLAO|nr:acyltransferase [Flavobacterium urocaniciphilum]SEP54872.1 Peptidoglycan/LPS O-acetylase OafA/YrhL, contains acyltransferase and SGNH-hydrolase domains [Flavobacterium urocaniciphilum]